MIQGDRESFEGEMSAVVHQSFFETEFWYSQKSATTASTLSMDAQLFDAIIDLSCCSLISAGTTTSVILYCDGLDGLAGLMPEFDT